MTSTFLAFEVAGRLHKMRSIDASPGAPPEYHVYPEPMSPEQEHNWRTNPGLRAHVFFGWRTEPFITAK
jgi:hypothetical protein